MDSIVWQMLCVGFAAGIVAVGLLYALFWACGAGATWHTKNNQTYHYTFHVYPAKDGKQEVTDDRQER